MKHKMTVYASNGNAFKEDLINGLTDGGGTDLISNGWILLEDVSMSSTGIFGNMKLLNNFDEIGEFVHDKTGYAVIIEQSSDDSDWRKVFVKVPVDEYAYKQVLYGVCGTLKDYLSSLLDDSTRYSISSRIVEIVSGDCHVSKDVLDKVSVIYRPHRGSLEESMENLNEFFSIEDMKQHIIKEWEPYGETYTMDDIVIGPIEGDDERIGWKSYRYVCVTHMQGEHFDTPQCVGMCTIYLRGYGIISDDISNIIVEESVNRGSER